MRAWNELVALLGDIVPVPLLALILAVLTTVTALLWYWWPQWLPRGGRDRSGRRGRRTGRRWPGWRWPRFAGFRFWRRRRRRRAPAAWTELPGEELPELPARALTLSADELAAQGRYKEAVRERLRAVVRELVEREVIEYRPGWTVTELAGVAGQARPPTAPPLGAATDIFSRIWYAQQPASASDDVAMRAHAERVRAALDERQVSA